MTKNILRLNWKSFSLIFSAVFVISIYLISSRGMLDMANGYFYDKVLETLPQVSEASSILLIETPYDYKYEGNEIWLKALDALQQMQAKQIVFTFLPKNVTKDFYQKAKGYKNVLFGLSIKHTYNSAPLLFEPMPEFLKEGDINFGIVRFAPATYGIHRKHYAFANIQDKTYKALEVVVAEKYLKKQINLKETYTINFRQGLNGIPRVTLKDILSSNIMSRLVYNKIVLIGFSNAAEIGFNTPITPNDSLLSPVEFHGHALHTLISQDEIVSLNNSFKLILFTVLIIVNLVFYFFAVRRVLWFIAMLILCILCSGFLLFNSFFIQIPIIELLIFQLVSSVIIIINKSSLQESKTSKLLYSASAKLERRFLPGSFFELEEYWSQVIAFVSQTLDLKRAIFLEKVAADHRVKEVIALHCSLTDIHEQRRDYERTPYSSAIEENGPIKIIERDFFKNITEDEQQYLVPLLFANQVFGFWAFTIDSQKVERIPMFIISVQNYASQIGELLYHRQKWQSENYKKKIINRFIKKESVTKLYEQLNDFLALLEFRLALLSSVLDNLSTSAILYDLFGKVLIVNKNMLELMKRIDIDPYKMTIIDLLITLSLLDRNKAYTFLQDVVLRRASFSINIFLTLEHKTAFLLNIRPIYYNKETDLSSEIKYPFNILGLLFELIEINHITELYKLKENLFNQLDHEIRNDLESINLATSLLTKKGVPEDKKEYAFTILRDKIKDIDNMLLSIKSNLTKNILIRDVELYPVDAIEPLTTALDLFSEIIKLRRITFKTDIPLLANSVCASPLLKEIFITILEIIIDDAVENTEIFVTMKELKNWIIFDFSNKGLGMSSELFNEYLFSNKEITSDEFIKLRAIVKLVNSWGGKFEASSDIGKGISIRLILRVGLLTTDEKRYD